MTSKYIFRDSINQNPLRTKENENNINFYWINFCNISFIFVQTILQPKAQEPYHSLIQIPIAYHVFSVSFNRASVIMNFKDSATNKMFTMEVLHVTNKISEFSREIHFKLLWIYGPEKTAYLDTFHAVHCHQNGK